MESIEKDLFKKMEDEKNDATKPFPNAEKASAAEINKGGDPRLRNYMGKENTGVEGPNWEKMSRWVDGPTTLNAGIFK
jgi:hypothetical protein